MWSSSDSCKPAIKHANVRTFQAAAYLKVSEHDVERAAETRVAKAHSQSYFMNVVWDVAVWCECCTIASL